MRLTLTIPDLQHVEPLKEAMRELYHQCQVFCFHGELGAGKTAYIKLLCQDLGVEEGMSSPSFGIVNEYDSPEKGSVYHFDLYRLKDPEELIQIGWEDYLQSDSLIFVEWPEQGGSYIPDDAVHLSIENDPLTSIRTVTITDNL